MIDWIGYGWMWAEGSGPDTYFADLTLEVPRGDVVAVAAVSGFSVGLLDREPGSIAAYIRQYEHYNSGILALRDLPPDPTNNVLGIVDCTWIRFRTTVFQARAFAQGLVFHHAVPPPAPPTPNPKITAPKWSVRDYEVHVGGKRFGSHRVMALARGSTLPLDEILASAATEAARHFGVAQRKVVTRPARRSRSAARSKFF
jgi:hypothetical protein